MSLTEIKEEQNKEGDTFLVPRVNLKLCSSESAQKIREKNYPEVLCPESGIEQLEDTDAIPKGGDSLPQPCSLQCFPDLKSHSTLHKSSLLPRISGLFEVVQIWPNSLVCNNSNSKISA